MIARIWHGTTRAEVAETYGEYVRRTGVAEQRRTPGNRGSMLLRRTNGEGTAEFLVISLWDSIESIRAFAGDSPETAVYFPEDDKYLLELEPAVLHYEVPVLELG